MDFPDEDIEFAFDVPIQVKFGSKFVDTLTSNDNTADIAMSSISSPDSTYLAPCH